MLVTSVFGSSERNVEPGCELGVLREDLHEIGIGGAELRNELEVAATAILDRARNVEIVSRKEAGDINGIGTVLAVLMMSPIHKVTVAKEVSTACCSSGSPLDATNLLFSTRLRLFCRCGGRRGFGFACRCSVEANRCRSQPCSELGEVDVADRHSASVRSWKGRDDLAALRVCLDVEERLLRGSLGCESAGAASEGVPEGRASMKRKRRRKHVATHD